MLVTCVRVGVHSYNLTYGQQYDLIEEDEDKLLVRIRLPNGRLRRFPRLCFDLIPALVKWEFASKIEDELNQGWLPEVHFTLSDGTVRWCILTTPQWLAHCLEPPMPHPGFWASNLIVVRNYAREVVEAALRDLDEQGELIAASKLIEPFSEEEEMEEGKLRDD